MSSVQPRMIRQFSNARVPGDHRATAFIKVSKFRESKERGRGHRSASGARVPVLISILHCKIMQTAGRKKRETNPELTTHSSFLTVRPFFKAFYFENFMRTRVRYKLPDYPLLMRVRYMHFCGPQREDLRKKSESHSRIKKKAGSFTFRSWWGPTPSSPRTETDTIRLRID